MQLFSHKGKKFITINGKEFYLLQGFKAQARRYGMGDFVFLQVAGRSPLHYEDLPEKGWKIVRSKTAQGIIFTAYDEAFFDYDTAKEDRSEAKKEMLFVGRNRAGGLYLALYVSARLLRVTVSDDDLKAAVKRIMKAEERSEHYPLIEIEDEGNEKNTAYFLRGIGNSYQEMGEEELKSLIEKPKTNGRRKKK